MNAPNTDSSSAITFLFNQNQNLQRQQMTFVQQQQAFQQEMFKLIHSLRK